MTHAQQVPKDLEGRVANLEADKQRADEELKRFKDEYDVSMEKHEKEMAKIRRREALTRTSAIDEFKVSDEHKEAVERANSLYFGEGFDLCKKQISILHLDLDIHDQHINPDLVDEYEEEEKNMPDVNLP